MYKALKFFLTPRKINVSPDQGRAKGSDYSAIYFKKFTNYRKVDQHVI